MYTDTEHFGQTEGESCATTSTDGTCTITIPKNTEENVFFTGTKTMRPCLICGDGVDELVGFGAVICDKCKEAVMHVRKTLDHSSFDSDYICPTGCGGKLDIQPNMVHYHNMPSCYRYKCNKCGFVEYRRA